MGHLRPHPPTQQLQFRETAQAETVPLRSFGGAKWRELGLVTALRLQSPSAKADPIDIHHAGLLRAHWQKMGLVENVELRVLMGTRV